MLGGVVEFLERAVDFVGGSLVVIVVVVAVVEVEVVVEQERIVVAVVVGEGVVVVVGEQLDVVIVDIVVELVERFLVVDKIASGFEVVDTMEKVIHSLVRVLNYHHK